MDKEDLAYLSQLADQTAPDDLMLFYAYTLQKLENPLAMNLFWETWLFHGLLYLKNPQAVESYNVKELRQGMRAIIFYRRAQDWDALYHALLTSRREAFEKGYRISKSM